ncbi:MAG TPA: hypothetical protein VFN72_11760 [Solirubrobacterales bacterium]|nr:hypothetical protein [Solirubrobacterales bacterium]
MAGASDDLVAALVRGWATVAQAWLEAANAMTIGFLDLADAETGPMDFNQQVVIVPRQPAATPIHPRGFTDWDQNELAPAALTLEPAQIAADAVTKVRLVAKPPPGTASGTYTGSLHDPTGTCVFEEVVVYVVGDKAP